MIITIKNVLDETIKNNNNNNNDNGNNNNNKEAIRENYTYNERII